MASKKPKEIEMSPDDNSVTFNDLKINLHPTTFQYLNDSKKVKVGDRASVIEKALNVGLLAAMQGRVAQAVRLFNSELAGEYDLLSTHMEVLEGKLAKDNKFKTDLEEDVTIALIAHCNEMGYDDVVLPIGTKAGRDGNKTGDALATINIDETKQTRIAIEVKFASNYQKGEKRNVTESRIRPSSDTVYSQILESQAVLDGSIGIFVIDEDLNPIDGPGIQYLPEIRGFIVKVNVLTGNYDNLCMCYGVARQIAIAGRSGDGVDMPLLQFLVNDLSTLLNRKKYLKDRGAEIIGSIKKNQDKTMAEVEKILIGFDSELVGLQQAMAWVQKCLEGLITTGELSAEDAFELYTQKNAQIDYQAKKKELATFYEQSKDD
jgi:hypothetical protein